MTVKYCTVTLIQYIAALVNMWPRNFLFWYSNPFMEGGWGGEVRQNPLKKFEDPVQLKKNLTPLEPKSERYKQGWSVSEQHFLERRLSENPDSGKNRCERLFVIGARTQNIQFRWSNISKATGDRHTLRRVTNHVQKHLKKLKLCGVKVEQA